MQVLLSPVIEQGLNLHLQCASVLLGSSFTAHGAIAEPSGGGVRKIHGFSFMVRLLSFWK